METCGRSRLAATIMAQSYNLESVVASPPGHLCPGGARLPEPERTPDTPD